MTIDWGSAPSGATGAMVANFDTRAKGGSTWLGKVEFVPNGVDTRDLYREGPDAWTYYERPMHWPGEGLPPVGEFVEALIDHSWVSAEVLAHGVEGEDEVAVLQVGSRIKTATFTGIRPVRTPEQLAAAEVDTALALLPGEVRCKSVVGRAVQLLIDAGYRKP